MSRIVKKVQIFLKEPINIMVLLNILCPIMFIFICEVHFDSTNDQFLSQIFSGVFGHSGVGYGQVNFILGHFLKALYNFIPCIPWFTLMQYGCVFVSFVILTCMIIKTTEHWGGMTACIIFLMVGGYECYARISYMKTATICVMTSFFILYRFVTNRMKANIFLPVGSILIFIGYAWWNKSVILSLFIMGFPMLVAIIKEKKKIPVRWLAGIFSFVVVGIGILSFSNQFYIRNNHQIEEYTNYISTWTRINNYGWPDFYENIDLFEKLEITENEYTLLIAGDYIESYPISLEKLQKIEDVIERPEMNLSKILDYTRKYPLHFFKIGIFLGYLIVFFLFSLSETKRKVLWGFYFSIVSYVLFFFCFMNNIDEITVNRVVIWIALLLGILTVMENIHVTDIEMQKYYSFIIGIATVIIINQQYSNINDKYKGNIYEAEKIINFTVSDEKNLYFTNNTEFFQKDMPLDILNNGMYQGYNIMKLPYIIYNESVSFEDFEENISLMRFLSADYAEKTASYMKEQYSKEYIVNEVDIIGNTVIYGITVADGMS